MAQKASKIVKCSICGFECPSRGMAGHIRLKHKIVVTTITEVIPFVSSHSDSSREHADLSRVDSVYDDSRGMVAVPRHFDSSPVNKFEPSYPSEGFKKAAFNEQEKEIIKVNIGPPQPLGTSIFLREKIGCLGFTMYTRYKRLFFMSNKQAVDYARHTAYRRGTMEDYTHGNDPDVIIEGREIFLYNG